MSKFINPFTDVGFKMIFGQEISKPLLVDFLNCLLTGERHITDVQFMDKQQLPEGQDDRGLIYDVYCKTDTGERIVVEMQNRSQAHFKDRALLYLSKAVVGQSRKGKEGSTYAVSAVYGIFFMNFRESAFGDTFRTDVGLCDLRSHELFSNKMRMVFLQLPLFEKTADNCENFFERWIYVLKNMEILNRMPWAAQYAAFQRLSEICEVAALTPQERQRYEESIKVYRDNLSIAERAMEEGREEGRVEEKREMARKLKSIGMSFSQISGVTGLSEEVISGL